MTRTRVVALLAPVVIALAAVLPLRGSSPAAASGGMTYGFTAPPIAPAGSIGPGQAVTFTLRVLNNGVLDPGGVAYVGYFQGGHVSGDQTVLQCASGNVILPSTGTVPCNAASDGKIPITYTVPLQPPAQGRADWVAQATASASSNHAVEHYVYCTVYRFNPSPITGSQNVTLTARDGLDQAIPSDTVYLSFKGAGSATVSGVALTSTPTLFTTDSTGTLIIAFTTGSGTGAITVQDRATSPTEKNTDTYAPSAPVVSIGDNTVFEGDQLPGVPAQFTVSISPIQTTDTTVKYVTLCGIGDKGCGEDFTQVNAPTTITIAAGQSSAIILVRQFSYIGGNAGETYNEGYYVQVENPSAGVVGRSVGAGMLSPDVEGTTTALPYLYTGSAAALPALGGQVPLYFTVTLGAIEQSPVTFTYATARGSALGGSDYTDTSGTATIPSGQTSTVITVMLLPNSPPPNDKSFTLTIAAAPGAAGGATISQATGTGTVLAG